MSDTTAKSSTATKVLDALRAHPGATTEQLADAAGVSRSTATKALAAFATDNLATRTHGIGDGGKRAPDLWYPTKPEPASSQAGSPTPKPAVEAKPAAASSATGNDSAIATGRLPSGALRGQIEQYLAEHPDAEYTPTALGHLLGRSSGAIANALEKLVANNYAVLIKPKPRTYQAPPGK